MALLLQAGDWFQVKDHYRAARSYYAMAEELAASSGFEHPLATPVQLLYPLPPTALRARGLPRDADTEARYVEVEFRVHADGTVDTERVVQRDLGKSAVNEVLNALSVARYRPRFVDGRAVDTDGVRLSQPIPDLR